MFGKTYMGYCKGNARGAKGTGYAAWIRAYTECISKSNAALGERMHTQEQREPSPWLQAYGAAREKVWEGGNKLRLHWHARANEGCDGDADGDSEGQGCVAWTRAAWTWNLLRSGRCLIRAGRQVWSTTTRRSSLPASTASRLHIDSLTATLAAESQLSVHGSVPPAART